MKLSVDLCRDTIHIPSLPLNFEIEMEFRRELPLILTQYTWLGIPVNLDNHPA